MLLACGSEERELERLGSATRWEPFWIGLDASGMVGVGVGIERSWSGEDKNTRDERGEREGGDELKELLTGTRNGMGSMGWMVEKD